LYLVVGPGVVAVLILTRLLVLIAELAAQQPARIVRDSAQPLFHGLLLLLFAAQRLKFFRRQLLLRHLLILLCLFGCPSQFFLQRLKILLAGLLVVAL
jgi:hypothetical protein